MADERGVTYEIGIKTGDAQSNLDRLVNGLQTIEQSIGQLQIGAQSVSRAISDMGVAGASAMSEVGQAASDMGSNFDTAGDDARAAIKNMGADAESFGSAFRKTMAQGIKDGQSLAKSFQTGLSGALAYTEKKFTGFRNNVTKGVKNIGTAFLHPIQTIRGALVNALEEAEDAEEGVGDAALNTERDIKDLGDSGAKSGNAIEQAMSNALKVFLGFQAIKAGVSALDSFVKSALRAAAQTENIGAKFDRLFKDTDTSQCAENFSNAVQRSESEVKSFLVKNKVMYEELGITGKAADQLSEITTSLAYYFGNAFKMDDAEALAAIQAALQGDTSALTEFGIKLDDATIKEHALKV